MVRSMKYCDCQVYAPKAFDAQFPLTVTWPLAFCLGNRAILIVNYCQMLERVVFFWRPLMHSMRLRYSMEWT